MIRPITQGSEEDRVRLSQRIARLFMDGHQRSLVDPSDYHRRVDAGRIMQELDGLADKIDHETYGAMRETVQQLGLDRDGTLSIAQVVDAKRAMDEALSRPHDNSIHEWAIIQNCGNSALIHHMIRRANRIAQEIQPGAQAMLEKAFG